MSAKFTILMIENIFITKTKLIMTFEKRQSSFKSTFKFKFAV